MTDAPTGLTLKELVAELTRRGVFFGRTPARAIRYYQAQGWIPEPHRGKGPEGQPNVAYYDPSTVETIIAIRGRKVGEKTAAELEAEEEDAWLRPIYQAYIASLSEKQQDDLVKAVKLKDPYRDIFSGTQTDPPNQDALIQEVRERVPFKKVWADASKYLVAHFSPSEKAALKKLERESGFEGWSTLTAWKAYRALGWIGKIKTALLDGRLEEAYRHAHFGTVLAEGAQKELLREFRDNPHPRARQRKGRAKR